VPGGVDDFVQRALAKKAPSAPAASSPVDDFVSRAMAKKSAPAAEPPLPPMSVAPMVASKRVTPDLAANVQTQEMLDTLPPDVAAEPSVREAIGQGSVPTTFARPEPTYNPTDPLDPALAEVRAQPAEKDIGWRGPDGGGVDAFLARNFGQNNQATGTQGAMRSTAETLDIPSRVREGREYVGDPNSKGALDRAAASAINTVGGAAFTAGFPGMSVAGTLPGVRQVLHGAGELTDEYVGKPLEDVTGSKAVRAGSNIAAQLLAAHAGGKILGKVGEGVRSRIGRPVEVPVDPTASPVEEAPAARVVTPEDAARIVAEQKARAAGLSAPDGATETRVEEIAPAAKEIAPQAPLVAQAAPETPPAPVPEPVAPKRRIGRPKAPAPEIDAAQLVKDANDIYNRRGGMFSRRDAMQEAVRKATAKAAPAVDPMDLGTQPNTFRAFVESKFGQPWGAVDWKSVDADALRAEFEGKAPAPPSSAAEPVVAPRQDVAPPVEPTPQSVAPAAPEPLPVAEPPAPEPVKPTRRIGRAKKPAAPVEIDLGDGATGRIRMDEMGVRRAEVRPSADAEWQRVGGGHPTEASAKRAMSEWKRSAEPAPPPAAPAESPPRPSPASEEAPPARFLGRPGGSESGAVGPLPGPKPLADVLPPGTPEERAAVAGVKERIRFGEAPKEPIGAKIRRIGKVAESEMVRREAPFRSVEKDIAGSESPTGLTAQAKFAQGSSETAAQNLYEHGVLDERTVPAIEKALEAVPKAGRRLSDVSAYAAAKRALLDYEPNKLESGFDRGEAQKVVDLYEKNHPEVVRAADAIAETNRMLRSNLAEADRWTPERLKEMEDRNKYPVQFAREFGPEESAGSPTKRGGPLPGPKLLKRTGGTAPIRDPLVMLKENFRRMVAGADQARVKHAFLDLLQQDPIKAKDYAEEMTPAQVKAQIPDFEKIAQKANPTGDPADFAKSFDEYDKAFKAGIIPVETPGGGTKFLRVTDPTLATALKGGDYQATHAALKIAGDVTALQRAGITQASPSFLPRNLIRDLQTYLAQAKNPNDFTVWTNLVRGIGQAIRGEASETPGLKRFVKPSAINEAAMRARLEGFYNVDTIKEAPKSLARMEEGLAGYYLRRPQRIPGAAARGVFNAWRSMNSGVEHAPRYAALIDSLESQGWKPGKPLTRDMLVQAGNAAQEATVNFRLGGNTGKFLNRYVYNFLNPQIQGIEQLRQSFAENPRLVTRRLVTYGVAPAVAGYLYWHSSPERKKAWDRMTPYRRSQINVPIGENKDGSPKFISLPPAQEAGSAYSATTAALDMIENKDKSIGAKEFGEIASRVAPGPTGDPFNWLAWVPSVGQPIAEVGAGKFSFSGRSINPRGMEGGEIVAPQEVKQPYSSRLGYMIANALHEASGGHSKLTTADIDAIISGYGGTAARDVLRAAPGGETEAGDTPMVGGFFPRASESKWTDDYYSLRNEYEGQTNLARSLKRREPEVSRGLRLPPGVADDVSKIDTALRAARERYQAAKAEDRPAIAARMDDLAQRGIRLLNAIGTGKTRPVPSGVR